MAYIALYRKYRSQSFGELMGQEHVTRTLQGAIKTGHIAHAYLFHGARGCGKTSTARLLARALNCVAQEGPTPEPCGECRLCVSIRDGVCMDVIEMDAASETSIDDVREKIIENVQYAPGEARYKVYIIDEVHDLSAKAFDALLKTLEEPPSHVVFILATTELHKVPITIKSRCQPFQFKRGSLQDLAASVQRVVEAEGYTAEQEAVFAIARSAEGSWRDALSLLEQVLAYSDGHITAETVHQAIGTVGAEMLARVTETLARGCWDETLALAAELIESGKDVRQLLTALSGHLRDLMLISAGAKQAAAQELGAERLALLAPQAALFDPPTLLAMMGELAKAEREVRFTNQHRWLLERTLLSLLPGNQAPLPGPLQEPSNPTRVGMALATPKNRGREQTPPQPSPSQGEGVQSGSPPPYEGGGRGEVIGVRATPPLAATPTVVPRPPVNPSQQAQEAALSAEEEAEESDLAEEEPIEETILAQPPQARKPAEKTPAPAAPAPAPATASRFADAVTVDVVQRAWPRILKQFKQVSPSGIPFLEKAEVVGLEGNVVVLAFQDSFARDRIHNNARGRAKVEETINQVLKTEGYKIRCELGRGGDSDGGAGRAAPVGPSTPPAAPEMALLDAPLPTSSTPARIMDIDLPAEPPPTRQTNGTTASAPPPSPAVPPAEPEPPGRSLLTEALELFGGEVVSTERIRKDA